MRYGSLFSGIGGFDLGLDRAGMECAWQVEKDEFCRAVLARHWPGVVRHGDIREVDVDQLERVDLVAGGFPCQPSSQAGARRGREDARWLWPEFVRVLRAVRPRYVLVENVPGLLSVDGGAAFGGVLSDLAGLGLDAEWSCVSACAVGAPHSRERVFLLAYPAGDDGPGDLPRDPASGSLRGLEPGGGGGAAGPDRWLPEPALDRVAHGVPRRVVRPGLEAVGNAVVPQVAEMVARILMQVAGAAA